MEFKQGRNLPLNGKLWLIGFIVVLLLNGTFFFDNFHPGTPAYGTTTPKSGSFEPGQLENIREQAQTITSLKSLLIHHRGERVLTYYSGITANEAVNIKSAAKSVLSALVGIALHRGDLEGLDQQIHQFFPEILKDAPKIKREITVRQLLLMRSGLESTSFGNYGPWVSSDNWLKYALTRPMVETPGEVTDYSTGNSHIISAILTEATGRDLRAYAQDHLFDPLNVTIQAWQKSPEGYRFGGNNFSISPEGFLRFGRLYLNDGKWDQKQVIPEDWVEQSTRRFVTDTHHGYPYGYYWWNARYHGHEVDFAWGHGGQFVFVVPELDLVVATTSNLQYATGREDYIEKIHRFLEQRIIGPLRTDS